MNIKEIQAAERIIKRLDQSAKLVIRYREELITGNFYNEFNPEAFINNKLSDVSYAKNVCDKFYNSHGNSFPPFRPSDLKILKDFIYNDDTDKIKAGYFPAIQDVHSLTGSYDLPFLLVEDDDELELVSVIFNQLDEVPE